MKRPLTQNAVWIALVALLAGGCAGGPPPMRHYLVTPLEAPAAALAPGTGVVVAGVRLPPYLDRPQLVTRSGNRVQLEEFHQWGGSLDKDLTRVMAENLSRMLGSDGVVAAPHTLRVSPAFRVEIEILRFERADDARVHLAAKWRLTRGADGTVLASPTTWLTGDPLQGSPGFDATVAAMSRLYGDLSRAIALAVAAQAKAVK